MMKNLFLIVSVCTLIFSSCEKKTWSEEDKKTFLNDCIAASNGVENSQEVCNCGLEKAMEAYPTKKAAENAIQKMSDREIMLLYEDCFD